MGVGSSFWWRVVLFLFVCFFQLLRWVIILFVKSHKWVRFSFFFFFFFFVLVLFCFVLFFLQNVQFPHHNLGSGWSFFFFFFFFLSRRLIKFFAFFYFCSFVCLYFILFFFLLQKFRPPWYQMVRPYPYSITQMMVDITSSTILNYRAIQWKILFQSETLLIHSFNNVK